MKWYPYDPIQSMGNTFGSCLWAIRFHTLNYGLQSGSTTYYLLLFPFFFYISTSLIQGSCTNIHLELLQVKTQLKYVKINRNIVKYTYKCLWVRYSRQSDIVNRVYCFRSAQCSNAQMLQCCVFLVLKQNCLFHKNYQLPAKLKYYKIKFVCC